MLRRGDRAGLLLATSVFAFAGAADAGETISYGYDSLGRLVRVERSGTVNSGVNSAYSYDSADNRTNVTVSGLPLVVGGGFEAPEIGTGYAYRPAGSPAAFAGNSGVTGNGSVFYYAAAPEGDQIAFVQGGDVPGAISLPVTGLTPGMSYKISFRISGRAGYWSIPISLSFNGAALGTFTAPTNGFTSATSAAFTATGSSGTLTFTGAGSINNNGALDRVTVAAVAGN